MSEWASRYVGIPFSDDGCSFASCHCWGLCRLIYRHELDIDLPAYGECSARDLVGAARRFRSDSDNDAGPWRAVDAAALKPFDVVLMSAMTAHNGHRRIPGHCGLMISPDRVLHVWKETAACHMALDHPRIRYHILSFHRHEQLA